MKGPPEALKGLALTPEEVKANLVNSATFSAMKGLFLDINRAVEDPSLVLSSCAVPASKKELTDSNLVRESCFGVRKGPRFHPLRDESTGEAILHLTVDVEKQLQWNHKVLNYRFAGLILYNLDVGVGALSVQHREADAQAASQFNDASSICTPAPSLTPDPSPFHPSILLHPSPLTPPPPHPGKHGRTELDK